MGFVTLGFFIFNELGVSGAIVQMISHGFVSGAMFLCIGVLYDRVHSREIASYGGVVNTMPKFAAFAVLFAMANCGLPGTAGFVGEWMVILGAVQYNFWIGLLAATTLIFGAAYTLWMVKRVYFGDVANDHVRGAAPTSNPRIPDAGRAGRGRAVDGPVPQALHRRDARLGDRTAQARGRLQAPTDGEPHRPMTR
jgi:NADH:ubiquinone oxidoreductase subunit 4 (subunit M)